MFEVVRQPRRDCQSAGEPAASQRADGGANEELETNKTAHRVAGQTENQHVLLTVALFAGTAGLVRAFDRM